MTHDTSYETWSHVDFWGPVYTEHQSQCCDNSGLTLVILFSLKTMELLENGLQSHSGANPLFSTRMHSSRMHTAHSSSRLLGGSASLHAGLHTFSPPLPGPGDPPQVWAWRPPSQTPQLPPWVWAWRPPPPVDRILDTRFWKYYLAPTSFWAVMRTVPLVSSQSCRSLDSDAWCKRALILVRLLRLVEDL